MSGAGRKIVMGKGNSRIVDKGLVALRKCFEGAKYLEEDAKRCAEAMQLGKHRNLDISDAAAMSMYEMITQGRKFEFKRTNSKGSGLKANIETYGDLFGLFNGDLLAEVVREPEAANDA